MSDKFPLLMADEDFSHRVVAKLRAAGYDVETPQRLAIDNIQLSDPFVLLISTLLGRVLLTFNRKDYFR